MDNQKLQYGCRWANHLFFLKLAIAEIFGQCATFLSVTMQVGDIHFKCLKYLRGTLHFQIFSCVVFYLLLSPIVKQSDPKILSMIHSLIPQFSSKKGEIFTSSFWVHNVRVQNTSCKFICLAK